MHKMKLKVLALSLVGLFTLAACGGNSNKGNSGGLPSGGDNVDVTDPEKSALLLAGIQEGLNKSLDAATDKGISLRLDASSNVDVTVNQTEISLKNGKFNLALDGKADPAIKTASMESPLDALQYLEAVLELRVGGQFNFSTPVSQYDDSGAKIGEKQSSLSINAQNVGFRADVTNSTLYADLSDRSILNFALNNYQSVFSFLGDLGADIPTVAQLEEMLGTDDLGQYATNLWDEWGLDKIKVSAEDVAELMGGSSSDGAAQEELEPRELALFGLEPTDEDEVEEVSEMQMILEVLAASNILVVKEYENQLGVELSINKDKIVNAYKVYTWLEAHDFSLEGFDPNEVKIDDEDPFNETLKHMRKMTLSAAALFDSEYRPTSLTMNADVDFDILGEDYNQEKEEYEQVIEATIKGDASVKFSCDFSGPKVNPGKQHEGYTPISSIIAAIEAMTKPTEGEGRE